MNRKQDVNIFNENLHDTSERRDCLLSSFEIVRANTYQRGRPYQQTCLMPFKELTPTDGVSARLKQYRNWNGHSYAEEHVEEWVARCPGALFPRRVAHVLASQNYAHLPEKIDLLLVDDRCQLHIVELKDRPVANNDGVSPDEIYGQLNRYLEFLKRELLPCFPAVLTDYYTKFSRRFLGCGHDLMTDLQQTFGIAFIGLANATLVLCPTLLTEGYDNDAVDYFRVRQTEGGPSVRLLYYRFYVLPGGARHFIEFWEVQPSVHCKPVY